MGDRLIGVNLLYVRPGYVGGTVRYAHEMLRHLVRLPGFRWRLYVQKGAFPTCDPLLAAIPRSEFDVVGGLAGRVMLEHLVLPVTARQDGVALLFSPGFVSPLWGSFRRVVAIHDLYYRRFPEFVRPWQRRYWSLFLPASLRRADAAITISDCTRKDLSEAFGSAADKVVRIYPGADSLPPGVEWKGGVADPYCLLVGNITPNKNIDAVLGAFSILRKRSRRLRLVVAGSDLFGLLAASLSAIEPKPDVEMLTHVSDERLAELYGGAECLIQASHYEGFGLPVVEAMGIGCPVVASDIAVLREICGPVATYFPPDSPERLAEVLDGLSSSAKGGASRAQSGRQRAQGFRWEEAARSTAELFRKVIDAN